MITATPISVFFQSAQEENTYRRTCTDGTAQHLDEKPPPLSPSPRLVVESALVMQSENLLFHLDFISHDPGGQKAVDDLWESLRQNAVEAGQVSPPLLTVFADECLFCAVITKKPGIAKNDIGSHPGPNTKDLLIEAPSAPPSSGGGKRRNRKGKKVQGAVVAAPTSPASSNVANTNISTQSTVDPPGAIGLIYLHSNATNSSAQEANIGVIIHNQNQYERYAQEAVEEVLRWAFEDVKFHRVQAAIIDAPDMDRPLRLFIGLGFIHEGTRRRSVFQPERDGMAGMWKDVTYLAMLDTDWVVRKPSQIAGAPMTLWGEMLARHEKEREQTLKWEDKHRKLKKSISTETLRGGSSAPARPSAADFEEVWKLFHTEPTESSMSSLHGSTPPSPGPGICVTLADEDPMAHEMADATSDSGRVWAKDLEDECGLDSSRFDMCRNWLNASSAHRLALPSIPSSRGSDAGPETPVTMPSPLSPGLSLPPDSPMSEDDVSPLGGSPRPRVRLPTGTNRSSSATVKNISPRASMRPRASSRASASSYSSLSSLNSWSDAHSVVNGDIGGWDMINAHSSDASSSRSGF